MKTIILSSDETSNVLCKPLCDTVRYWRAAALNQTLQLPCPNQEFDNQMATRTCILHDDGINGNRPIWSAGNYSLCPDPDNYSLLFLDVARREYIETREEVSIHSYYYQDINFLKLYRPQLIKTTKIKSV